MNNIPNPVLKIILKEYLPLLQFYQQRKFLSRKSSLQGIRVHLFQGLAEYRKIIHSSLMKPFLRSDDFISIVHLISFWLLFISNVINLFLALRQHSLFCFIMLFILFSNTHDMKNYTFYLCTQQLTSLWLFTGFWRTTDTVINDHKMITRIRVFHYVCY